MDWVWLYALAYGFIAGFSVGVVIVARFYWRRERRIRAALTAYYSERG